MIEASRPAAALVGSGSGTVATVGTFDGVHRGHWQLLQVLRSTAERLGLPSVLVTFDPHPLAIVRPDSAPPLLTTPAEKIEVLAEAGINYVMLLRFDRKLAGYSPRRFVRDILIRRCGLRHLVIGHDHGFGKGRSGDVETLREIGAESGFQVDVVPAVSDGDHPISSTRIRRSLLAGDVTAAAKALGRPYVLRGAVIRGDGRGRLLGFPTANLRLPDPAKLVPMPGVYAVHALLRSGAADAVLHLGPRPTFPDAAPSIELHVLDFDRDLYGADVGVAFCARLRDIARFESAEALIDAMAADCVAARELFRQGAGACGRSPNSGSLDG